MRLVAASSVDDFEHQWTKPGAPSMISTQSSRFIQEREECRDSAVITFAHRTTPWKDEGAGASSFLAKKTLGRNSGG
jgi:hypothetical protein